MKPDDVVRNGLCIGCGVCTLRFPEAYILDQADGFLIPRRIDEGRTLTRDQEREFMGMCPGLGYKRPQRPGKTTALWGPVGRTCAAWTTDPSLRYQGSSGGALTGVGKFLLESGRVDGIVAIRPSRTDPLSNESVYVSDISQLGDLSGSRYAPAAPFQALATVPKTDRVAVVGKPCDVAGLRDLMEATDPGEFPSVSYYLSFFCAGTPSQDATEVAAENLGVTKTFIGSIKYRGSGWPGQFEVEDTRGGTQSMSYNESWGTILNKQLHHRCKLCQDGVGATADLVAADAWSADANGYPIFEEGEGRSAVLARTAKGEQLLAAAVAGGYLETSDFGLERLEQIQPYQVTRQKYAGLRQLAIRLTGRSAPRFRGLPQVRWWIQAPVTSLRQLVGAYRRARSGRL